MAELLVRAKPHWMDSFTQAQIDKLSKEELQSYNARSQIGDIIVVRPDGWEWGKEECLPNYVVIKLPNLKVEEIKKYEETLNEDYEDILIITVFAKIWNNAEEKNKWITDNQYKEIPTVIDIDINKNIYTVSGIAIKTRMLKVRKHQVPSNVVINYKTLNQSIASIPTAQITNFRNSIIEKTK